MTLLQLSFHSYTFVAAKRQGFCGGLTAGDLGVIIRPMSVRLLLLITGIAVVVYLGACRQQEPSGESSVDLVVATVNGVPILREEFENTLRHAEKAYILQDGGLSGALSRRILEKMIEDAGFELPQWGSSSGTTRAQRIFDGCFAGIAQANVLLAILTGTEVDDGTASEIGIFYAMMQTDPTKRGIVGMHDDWRTNSEDRSFQGKGLSDFVLGCILRGGKVVRSARAAVKRIQLWEEELESEGLLGADSPTLGPPPGALARPLGVGEDGMPTTKVYLAGPQYTPYARQYLEELAERMRDLGMEVFVPTMRLATDDPRPGELQCTRRAP